ncbi:sensor histidine kinase [Yinghuangia soli]|uniref:histidine kinase n=1 Tax=Yinghuangia soli TaxID=2908204 RepID=A0AA41TY26_9ACTN|nr:sensor histidine kinase [Yinghuangia soli]MCF2527413.1 sensor histidine kinase [Yinghuangia soli]
MTPAPDDAAQLAAAPADRTAAVPGPADPRPSRTERLHDRALGWLDELRRGEGPLLRKPAPVDIALVAVLAVLAVGGLFIEDLGNDTRRDPDAAGVILALLCVLPLLWRSSHSLRVLIAVTIPFLILAANHYGAAGASLGQLVAMYSAAVSRPRIPAAFALFFAEGTTLIWLALGHRNIGFVDVLANLAALFAVWAFARSVGFRRAYTAELEARADRLMHTREADTRAALAEERGRIARELHDVVAHHVSVMTVQASAAQRTIDRNPERAREAMASVEQTGRAALVEMRRLVGILRGNEDAAGGTVQLSEGHNAPQPGLDALEFLVQQVREAGVPVELTIEGVPAELPPGIDLAAYRIIQEALTNTLKHAGPAGSRVLLRYRPEEILVRIADDGRGAAATLSAPDTGRTGHGLLGMRERVALYGGRLYAGPRAGGGFEVLARIPLTPSDTRPSAARPQPARSTPAAPAAAPAAAPGAPPADRGGNQDDRGDQDDRDNRDNRTDRLEQNPA